MIDGLDISVLNKTRIIPGEIRSSIPKRTRDTITNRHHFAGNDKIKEICEQKLEFSPVSITPVSNSKGAALFDITSEQGERYLCKVGMFQDHHDPAYELYFNTVVRSYIPGFPAPDIVLVDLSGESIPFQYSIMRHIPGKTLKQCIIDSLVTDSDEIFELLGDTIRRIHAITVTARGFGLIAYSDLCKFVTHKTAPQVLQCVTSTFGENYVIPLEKDTSCLVRSFILSQKDYENILTIIQENIQNNSGSCFLHGDVSPGNILIEKNRITGILDGSGAIGFCEEELADLYVFLHSLEYTLQGFSAEKAFSMFLKGYGSSLESLTSDSRFRFFLACMIVSHIGLQELNNQKYLVLCFTRLLRTLF